MDVVLFSTYSSIIKSVKIVKKGKMVQGEHRHFLLVAPNQEERDEWVESLQRETFTSPAEAFKFTRSPSHATTAGRGTPRSTSTNQLGLKPIAEGWMRRRSEVNRHWQRRYFVLLKNVKKRHRVSLYYFTTQEMGQRMLELNVSTEQGVIQLHKISSIEVRKNCDGAAYRFPDPTATVLELIGEKKGTELLSPEDNDAVSFWISALEPYIKKK